MLAAEDEDMREAAKSLFVYNTEEQIRKMCLDREEYYQDLRNYERAISERDRSIASYEKAISERDQDLLEKDALIQQLLAEIEKLKAQQNL